MFVAASASACDLPIRDVDVVVGIRDAPPFSAMSPTGLAEGFAIDIWTSVEHELIAEGAMSSSEIVLCRSIADQEAALEDGLVDVVISPLTITGPRMQRYDFSQQYLQSGLTLAVSSTSAIDFETATRVIYQTVTQPGVVKALLIFLAANLLLAALLRLALRHEGRGGDGAGAEDQGWLTTLLEAVVSTTGLKGLGDRFKTLLGRLLEIFMAVVGTVLSATIFGVLTSAFVGSIGASSTVSAENLPGMRIATLEGSTAQQFLVRQYAAEGLLQAQAVCVPEEDATPDTGCLLYPGWPQAVRALDEGRVEAVLGDWIALSYLSRLDRYRGRVEVQSGVYLNEPYGWAIARDRPELRAAIDRALIEDMRDPGWRRRIEAYLGPGAVAPN
ncbi:transporter substrate-binding domain-containing protein [Rhodovulum steppense]|nr:transporter substrate-binding domain-containing protein [Rhodovulum steppense]